MATESINSTQGNTFKIPKWLHKRRKRDPDSIDPGVNANTQQNFLKKEVRFMFKKLVIKACNSPKNDRRDSNDDRDHDCDHDRVDLMLRSSNGVELDRPVKVLSVTPSHKKVDVVYEDEDTIEKDEEISKGDKKKIHKASRSRLPFSRLSIKSKVWRRMNPKLHNKSKELNVAGSNVNGAGTHINRKQLHNASKPPPSLVNDPTSAKGETTRSTLGQILLELHNSKIETWNHQKMSVREDQSNCSKPESEEEEIEQLWAKRILMGMKCRPLPSPDDL